ncbi:YjbF family lipoprotein [Sulfitobacter sp. F26204]|uniref:YjbF family lipoprotein n=1 Tax=Sulfitobacter sp. F26204 TaxID=2996014 RepID=UPI00225E0738|nr:YjbF family lipoprotein [Sulfitobacter sp. F26204]MCX7561620.1 YjbF family lipoprotein [Sulfitobacter sp. F26204]
MKWKFGILAGAAFSLAACGNQSFQDRAIGLMLEEPNLAHAAGQFPRFAPLLAAKRGPALDVQIVQSGLRGGFLRESTQGTIESWLGNDGVALIFDRGVLHGTRGLGAGMLASDVSASANAILAGRSGEVDRIHTFLNGNDIAVIRAYKCTIVNEGSETIQLDSGATSTRRMVETCFSLDQSFKNIYWVDTSRGRIVQSRQWSGEFVGQLAIQTVYNF